MVYLESVIVGINFRVFSSDEFIHRIFFEIRIWLPLRPVKLFNLINITFHRLGVDYLWATSAEYTAV